MSAEMTRQSPIRISLKIFDAMLQEQNDNYLHKVL